MIDKLCNTHKLINNVCVAWDTGDWLAILGYILLGVLAVSVLFIGKWVKSGAWADFIKKGFSDGTQEDK